MGCIHLEGMEFYAYHGHYDVEKVVGTKFVVDLTLETDLKVAGKSDKLEDTINYQEIYKVIQEVMKHKSNLIENVAHRIMNAVYDRFETINKATVKLSKMNPPLGGKLKCVSVTMSR